MKIVAIKSRKRESRRPRPPLTLPLLLEERADSDRDQRQMEKYAQNGIPAAVFGPPARGSIRKRGAWRRSPPYHLRKRSGPHSAAIGGFAGIEIKPPLARPKKRGVAALDAPILAATALG
jgi:hypothetical protein